MAKANTATATATANTVATARATGGASLASLAATRVAAVAPANAHKYGVAAKAVPAGVANSKYKLTAAGIAAAQAMAAGGKATVMGAVCLAAQKAGATQSQAVSGLAIVLAMRTAKQVVAAYATTRTGKYAPKGSLPCNAWCAGYVNGAANANKHGLLVKA